MKDIENKLLQNEDFLPEHKVSEVIQALHACDESFLLEVSDMLDVNELEATYEGIIVDPSDYDPDEVGRDQAIEVLYEANDGCDDARAQALEGGEKFKKNELAIFEAFVKKKMAVNAEGTCSTLWLAEVGDDTGIVVVALTQHSDGERSFWKFSKSRDEVLSEIKKAGADLVGL